MKKVYFAFLASILFLVSCDNIFNKPINGDGNVVTEERSISSANKIKSMGSFDLTIIKGETASVKVEADENLMPYIITDVEDGGLVIKTKDNYSLHSENKMRIIVTTNELNELDVEGSGDVNGEGKFTGADHLKISVAGSGNITLDVNTPDIDSHIAGSGNITITGETKSSKINIAGMGNYNAMDLKSEDVEIHIAGSGNTKVYAANNLDIHIAGSGDVTYKGDPTVKQDIAGSGKINKAE